MATLPRMLSCYRSPALQHSGVSADAVCRRVAERYLAARGVVVASSHWQPLKRERGNTDYIMATMRGQPAPGMMRTMRVLGTMGRKPQPLLLVEQLHRTGRFDRETHVRPLDCAALTMPTLGAELFTEMVGGSLDVRDTVIPHQGPTFVRMGFGDRVSWIPYFSEVFHPNSVYQQRLLEVVLPQLRRNSRVLVMGSGAGIDAATVAHAVDGRVDAVDICPFSVANTQATAVYLGLEHRIRVWRSDGFARVSGQYDVILFNAPRALPRTAAERGDGASTFDPGGQVLHRVLHGASKAMARDASLYVMADPDLQPYLPTQLRHEVVHTETAADAGHVRNHWAFAIHRVSAK